MSVALSIGARSGYLRGSEEAIRETSDPGDLPMTGLPKEEAEHEGVDHHPVRRGSHCL